MIYTNWQDKYDHQTDQRKKFFFHSNANNWKSLKIKTTGKIDERKKKSTKFPSIVIKRIENDHNDDDDDDNNDMYIDRKC